MKRLLSVVLVLAALLAVAGVVSAGHPPLAEFTISGNPTAFDLIPLADSGYAKARISNAGTVSGSQLNGTFTMQEIAVGDLAALAGANSGNMVIDTGDGRAFVRFSGPGNALTVTGAFGLIGGTGSTRGLVGFGSYSGGAAVGPFEVVFSPTEKHNPPACAVFGAALNPKNKKADWWLTNEGSQSQEIGSMLVHWPEGNGNLEAIRLNGKTIYNTGTAAPWTLISGGWSGSPQDRTVGAGKLGKLAFVFANGNISEAPSGYTVLVNFTNGCAVPWAAF